MDVAGLKRAIEAPRPVEIPLLDGMVEEDTGQGELPLEMPEGTPSEEASGPQGEDEDQS